MTPDELKDYLTRLRDDFGFFYTELARLTGGKEPGRMRLDIASWMQNGPARRGILATRKVGKTYIACGYDCWRLFRNPNEQILHCSASTSFARASLALERRWLEVVPFLRHLAPSGENRERDNLDRFDVATANLALLHSASVTAIGIMGQLPGAGATLVRPDDVETPENTMTQDGRRILERRIEGFEHLTMPGGEIVYLGTPQCEESIYRKLLERGYTFRAWPLAYPTATENIPGLAPLIVSDMATGRAKAGDPVFPERFNSDELALKRIRSTPSGFAMQCMLRTDLLEKEVRPLRLDDLIVLESMHRDIAPGTIVWGHRGQNVSTRLPIASVGFGDDGYYAPVLVMDKDWMPYHGTKAALDPAGRGKDEMAWAIVGQLHGNLYVKHVMGVHGGATPENLDLIVSSLRDNDARELIIETNFGGDYLIPLIEPIIRKFIVREGEDNRWPKGWSCAIVPIHSVGQKELRILAALAPVTQQHRLIISPALAKDKTEYKYNWAYQFTRLTKERNCLEHDDRLEATAMAVAAFKDTLYQDDAQRMKRKRDNERLETLRKINARFAPVKPPNWFSSVFK